MGYGFHSDRAVAALGRRLSISDQGIVEPYERVALEHHLQMASLHAGTADGSNKEPDRQMIQVLPGAVRCQDDEGRQLRRPLTF